MKRIFAVIMAVAAVLLFTGQTHAQVEPLAGVGQVVPIPCPIEVPDSIKVTCEALIVPENYADPNSQKIRLPYIILHSSNPNPAPDPLIYTAGGPGWSSLASIWGFVNSAILADRDVIVFEQRGNKYAQPNLVCENADLSEVTPGHTPCLDSYKAEGIDLSQYNTANMVRDLTTLRQTLGYEQWNLYGVSFSTSLMLLAMEADPDGVRSAILQSVGPPNETIFDHEGDHPLRAIEQMLNDCAADSGCAEAYPDLENQFFELVKDLNASPVEVEVESSQAGGPIPVEINGDTFLDWIVVNSYYQPAFPPFSTAYLPLLISEASDGNYAPLKGAAQGYWNGIVENSQWALGLLFAVNCQQAKPAAGDTRPAADVAASERLDGFTRFAAQREVCDAWGLPALPPPSREAIKSDIPALVLAGSYDPITPPEWSRETAGHLPNSTYVEFPGHGHEVTMNNNCTDELQAAFLNHPERKPDLSCLDQPQGPTFILPKDIYVTPGLAGSVNDIETSGSRGTPWIETVSMVSVVGLLALLLLFIIAGLVWLARGAGKGQRIDSSQAVAFVLVVLVIIILLAMPFLVTRINNEYLDGNMLAYSLGPSRDFGPATLLAWLMPLFALLYLALGGIVLWAWLSGRWSPVFRVATTLVLLFSLTGIMLGLRWGLFSMLV